MNDQPDPRATMQSFLRSANATSSTLDAYVNNMLRFCRGRLRRADPYLLKAIKSELSRFNGSTKRGQR